jgi:hypothetical protein
LSIKAVYEGTWARRDRWATLRSVVHAVCAFKHPYRSRQNRRHHRTSMSSLDDDDDESDGAMSIDSGAASSMSNCIPMPSNSNRLMDSTDNLKGSSHTMINRRKLLDNEKHTQLDLENQIKSSIESHFTWYLSVSFDTTFCSSQTMTHDIEYR